MKKTIFGTLLITLAACAGTSDNGLTRLDFEPKNCEFLYTVNSSARTYNLVDAYDYLEKTVIEQGKSADSYYIIESQTLENTDAIFGPKNTYKFKAKVFKCKK